jgi:membrane fusion protein, heavy metal efflux system
LTVSTLETKPAETVGSNGPVALEGASPPVTAQPTSPRRKSWFGRLFFLLVLAGAIAAGIYTYKVGPERARGDAEWALQSVGKYLHGGETTTSTETESPTPRIPTPPWDGYVSVRSSDAKNIGLLVVTVQPQTEPINLPMMGRTDYDPNSLTKIRPRFDTLVENVRAELGQTVKKGDPLVDLFSTELAAAKNDFQTAYVQWQHDLRLLELRENLYKSPEKAIAKQLVIDTRNDESKSRLAFLTAKEKLMVFGVREDQIEPLVSHLGDQPLPEGFHVITDKARMTRVSPVDGMIIDRNVVKGNLYDTNDVLMVIAPLEHLFVWVNLYEADQAKVAVGQQMEVQFPYLGVTVQGNVQYVAPEVSKETRAIKVRATVLNVDGKLKAEMLVRAILKIPPVEGQTWIPRQSMVVMNGQEYAFVQREGARRDDFEQFERRRLIIAEERDDHVVVKSGLKAGDHVASNGSLILAQLYEEQQMIATGMPVQ